MLRHTALFSASIVLVALAGCSMDTKGNAKPGTSSSGVGGAGGVGTSTGGAGGEDVIPSSGAGGATGGGGQGGQGGAPPEVCGDGMINGDDACDDGNNDSGDGCSGNCLLEQNFACPVPGSLCVSTVKCGDDKITGDETCEDGNTTPTSGDGCDASCHLEAGYKCVVIGARCEAAKCGDGILAGDEQCDDGDDVSGNGCSSTCRLEDGYKCTTPGEGCTKTTCGDKKTEGTEQCDDGNNDMGDGCTPECKWEPTCPAAGGACTSTCGDGIRLPSDAGGAEACEDGNTKDGDGCSSTCTVEPGYACTPVTTSPDALVLPIVYRDFDQTHPDFESFGGAGTRGLVEATLTANKPVYTGYTGGADGQQITSSATFAQWYADVPCVGGAKNNCNQTFLRQLTLDKQGDGSFLYSKVGFFPINGLGFGNFGNPSHNYNFTSEVRYWFQYRGGEVLNFTGDDDVWVFINKKLAVDLGGMHSEKSGTITLHASDGTGVATEFGGAAHTVGLGLEIGKIYEIVVFQAERHSTGSNYKLTLGNFVNAPTTCKSQCGDGVKSVDEACDDGTAANTGAYGGCNANCTRAPFCGDALMQDGEECDDGVNLSQYGGCAPGCKIGGSCGDGKIDSAHGEQCDDGTNDGSYGTCKSTCKLAAYCGDGTKDASEECDDGNKKNGDGCNSICKKEGIK